MHCTRIRTLLFILVAIAAPVLPRAAVAQPEAYPYDEVLRQTRLGSPEYVLRQLSGACFPFVLTAGLRDELRRESLRRDPRASRAAIAAVADYIEQHPCPAPQITTRPDAPPSRQHSGFAAVSGDVNLNNTLRGASLRVGVAILPEFDIVAGFQFGTTENARLRNSLLQLDTASQRVGSLSVATRLWLSRDSRRISAYVQGGGLVQVEAFEAYGNRANYTGLGILGGAGLGLHLTPRDLLFVEVEGNTVWVTSREESENVDADYRSSEGIVLHLGLTRFWGVTR